MIGIIDYGLGNLRSVSGALAHLKIDSIVSSSPVDLECCDRLILPGVGAFGDGMRNLQSRELISSLERMVVREGKPILGICLGAQLLGVSSTEFGHNMGLGWLPYSVVRLETSDPQVRIPHVGWNSLRQTADHYLFDGIPQDALFYFVHSYHMKVSPSDTPCTLATCHHGVDFCAVAGMGNIFAVQFHPEKSQRHGLRLLSNFANGKPC